MNFTNQDGNTIYPLFQKAPGEHLASRSPDYVFKATEILSVCQSKPAIETRSENSMPEIRRLHAQVTASERKKTRYSIAKTMYKYLEKNDALSTCHLVDKLANPDNTTPSKQFVDDIYQDHSGSSSMNIAQQVDTGISCRSSLISLDISDLRQDNIPNQRKSIDTEENEPEIPSDMTSSNKIQCRNDGSKLLPKLNGITSKSATICSDINPRPKKMLKVNSKTGTLVDTTSTMNIDSEFQNIGKRLSRNLVKRKSMCINIKYNQAIGQRLEQILNNCVSSRSTCMQSLPISIKNRESTETKAQGPAIHPLFLGKPTKYPHDPSTLTKNRENLSISKALDQGKPEKCKTILASGTSNSKDAGLESKVLDQRSSFISKTINVQNVRKFPKIEESAWPWRNFVHIRGINKSEKLLNQESMIETVARFRNKKLKEKDVNITQAENIIISSSNYLAVESIAKSIKYVDSDGSPAIPNSLRVPRKLLESGVCAQRQLLKQLKSRMQINASHNASSSEDEIQRSIYQLNSPLHSALLKSFASVATNLSAFDRAQCETQLWTQKYSPQKAEEVLQTGHEALILKDWLSKLTVKSIDAGSLGPKQSFALKTDPSIKKKRRSTKLDGFIVPTDDEDMVGLFEINDIEENTSNENNNQNKRTVVRGGEWPISAIHTSKIRHAILISGTHGCGKSAAVYAVAKELDFDVFEINSSSRRCGKDIIDKIGDMTLNHHVQNSKFIPQKDLTYEEITRANTAPVKNSESGHQGSLNSFFRPHSNIAKSAANCNNLSSDSPQNRSANPKVETKMKIQPKNLRDQKQSLILIEEADIIFKEDSQFWSTVENIIAISKRPIILTCNDESAIPISHESLHAILRFQPPPVDLAVDYMLTVAASEGHLIKREAVKTLYQERQLDLRASLSELNFWCQFAIGDVNRGLSWYYSRKNGKSNLDESGRPIRVFSKGTYEKGMGWLSQDILESDLPHLDVEEAILHQTNEIWNLDIGEWEKTISIKKWAEKIRGLCASKNQQFDTLSMFAEYAESMSDSDLLSDSMFATENHLVLDPSTPKSREKIYEEYPVAYKIIEAAPKVTYCHTAQSISLYLRSRARNLLQVTQHLKYGFEIQPELSSPTENRVIDFIRKKRTSPPENLQRISFSRAFDPISYPAIHSSWNNCSSIETSQFDRSQRIISEDLAPYVRSIVAYDAYLQREREKMSNLISEGGLGGKRRRTTRAAMSALEGRKRSETRREKYFGNALNSYLVGKTGTPYWSEALVRLQKRKKNSVKEESDYAVIGS